jgi:glutaredoxin 2
VFEETTKLQDRSAKLAAIVGEKEQKFIESIADETCEIRDESFDICCSLQQLEQEALDSTKVKSQTQEEQMKMTSTQADIQKTPT